MHITSFARTAALLAGVSVFPAVAQQNSSYLKMKVNPGRTGVFVDGKYVGPAANFRIGRKYAVAPGQHEVRLVEPRYEDVVKNISVEPGKTTKIVETMKAVPVAPPPYGILRTICPDKFAAVYVNGKFMGHADEFNNSAQGLKLNPGQYTVKIAPVNGADAKEETIKIEKDTVTIVRAGK